MVGLDGLLWWMEMWTSDPTPPSMLRTELRAEYVERRENFLEGIPEQYRDTAKRDKDMIFILSCEPWLKEVKFSGKKVRRDKEEFFRLVFHAEPVADWLVSVEDKDSPIP